MKSGNTLCELMSELIRTPKARARVTLWATLALAVAAGTASALTINLTYAPDATFTAAGLTAADIVKMKAANTFAALQFTSNYTDNINVNIMVTAVPGTGTLGMSNTSINSLASYAALRAAAAGDSTTPDDATALGAGGSLVAADPIGGSHLYVVSRAQRKALGLAANDFTNDGTFTFGGGFSYTYDPLNRAVAGKFDFIGVAMHEFSEIMGRIGLMGQNIFGQPDYMMFDLFHYTGATVRGLNNGPGRSFSINNGTTLLKAFNNAAANSGDLQDWASGTNDAFNAFSNSGVQNDLTVVDLRVMDVIGYNRATPHDFNSDVKADLIWQSSSTGQIVLWFMDGQGNEQSSRFLQNGANFGDFRVLAGGDLNSDGKPDLIFQSASTGQIVLWFMDGQGNELRSHVIGGNFGDFRVVGAEDLNSDGDSDLIWQSSSTGQIVLWFMDGQGNEQSSHVIGGNFGDFRVLAGGDLNGDGKPDLIFQSASTGQIVLWFMDGQGNEQSSHVIGGNFGDFRVVGAEELNSDGKADLIWQSASTGQIVLWFMDGQGNEQSSHVIGGNFEDFRIRP